MSEQLYEAPEPTDEPEPQPEPEPEPTPEPAAWSGVSQQDWEQTQQYLAQIGQAIPAMYDLLQQQGMASQQQPQELAQAAPEYDPFDPNSVDAYMEYKLQERLQEAFAEHLGPFEGLLGSLANERGEQIARQELDQIRGQIGDFNDDLAYVIASGIIDRGGDPRNALPQAAQFARDYENRIREEERSKYKSELQGLSGAPGEMTGGASTTEMPTIPTGPDRYKTAVENALSRRRVQFPIG